MSMYGFFLLQDSPDEGGWHDLVSKGFIEYIDTEEEETTMISMTIHVSKTFDSIYCSDISINFLSVNFGAPDRIMILKSALGSCTSKTQPRGSIF